MLQWNHQLGVQLLTNMTTYLLGSWERILHIVIATTTWSVAVKLSLDVYDTSLFSSNKQNFLVSLHDLPNKDVVL